MSLPLRPRTPQPAPLSGTDTAAPTTPFPNNLLDDVMPILSDTEWRLLCVVVRQTLGWRTQGDRRAAGRYGRNARKTKDWLTHGQIKARTGRASEAVSRAVDGLVRKNLVLVTGTDGRPLLTPQERRRCQGALFFSLAPRVMDAFTGDAGTKGSR